MHHTHIGWTRLFGVSPTHNGARSGNDSDNAADTTKRTDGPRFSIAWEQALSVGAIPANVNRFIMRRYMWVSGGK